MNTDAEAYADAEACDPRQSSSTPEHLQTASAIIDVHVPPHETINICCGSTIEQSQNSVVTVNVNAIPHGPIDKTASANIDHIAKCDPVMNNALAGVHTNSMSSPPERIELVALPPQHINPCASQLQTASATKPTPAPRRNKSKNIAKNMSSSGCQNKDMAQNVSIPDQSDDTTSALKGFNHLPHLKGERVGGDACIPSMHSTTNFSNTQ